MTNIFTKTLIFLSFLFFTACSSDKKTGIEGNNNDNNTIVMTEKDVIVIDKDKKYKNVKVSYETFSGKLPYSNKSDYPNIDIKISLPKLELKEIDISEKINQEIISNIINTPLYYLELNQQSSAKKFNKGNTKEQVNFLVDKIQYEYIQHIKPVLNQVVESENEKSPRINFTYELDVKVIFNDFDILTIYCKENAYTGGAHPNQNYKCYSFDLQNGGNLIKLSDIIAHNKMDKFSEKLFNNYKTSVNKNIAEGLSESGNFDEIVREADSKFFIKKEGLYFVLNPYQVASYAEGHQPMSILFKDLEPFLSENFSLNRLLN